MMSKLKVYCRIRALERNQRKWKKGYDHILQAIDFVYIFFLIQHNGFKDFEHNKK